ncbi:MAG: hypothetical protein HKN41_10060, partial [Ilumatobacter sp.]|nr:hypothetical protein [Ilumatobacter sp.]
MKTRTLMLLSGATALVIMIAGAVLLFQLSGQDDVAEPVAIGEQTSVGDMAVTVVDVVETDGVLDVTVRIGGVDDEDGANGFRLIASGRPVVPDLAARGEPCGATAVTPRECLVRFDVSGADGRSRVLFYERGDQQARWVLG